MNTCISIKRKKYLYWNEDVFAHPISNNIDFYRRSESNWQRIWESCFPTKCVCDILLLIFYLFTEDLLVCEQFSVFKHQGSVQSHISQLKTVRTMKAILHIRIVAIKRE